MSIELLHMDCMDYLRDCEDNAFDLAVVDPPYGIGISSNPVRHKHEKKDWDVKIPSAEYFSELGRVAKNRIIWGGNYFTEHLKPTSAWVYWDKMQDGFAKTLGTGELAYTTYKKPMRQFVYKFQGNYIGYPDSITLKTKTKRDLSIHPTQKPIALYEWLLKNYATPDQRILDTHLGSGSSAIAAHYFGCDFVGIELDKDYYDAACKRFNDETAQQALAL